MLGVLRQVKDEARGSPVSSWSNPPTRRVAEALRSHSRGSQRAPEVYSSSILKLVSRLLSLTSTSSVPTCPRGSPVQVIIVETVPS